MNDPSLVDEILYYTNKLEEVKRHLQHITRLIEEPHWSPLNAGRLPCILQEAAEEVDRRLTRYAAEINEVRDALKGGAK